MLNILRSVVETVFQKIYKNSVIGHIFLAHIFHPVRNGSTVE